MAPSLRMDAVAGLSRAVGNRATAAVIERGATRRTAPLRRLADEPAPPADIAAQTAFNPMDIMHKLLIAIDQSDASMVGGTVMQPVLKRKVNFPAVVQALSGLTAKQVKLVEIEYEYHEDNRTLRTDLFGKGESGFDSDLNPNQRAQLEALMAGTKAEAGATEEEQLGAAANLAAAKAAEVQRLLKGKPSKANVEQVMAILRQPKEANRALMDAYSRLGGLIYVDLTRTGQSTRAELLLEGKFVEADAQQVSGSQRRLDEVNAAIKVSEANRTSGDLSPFELMENERKLNSLRSEQKKLIAEIEATGQQAIAEAQAEGSDASARVQAVYGDIGSLKESVGEKSAPVIQAIVDNSPAKRIAAEIRRSAAEGKLTGAQLTAALRRLRAEAEDQARRVLPKGDPGIEAKADSIAKEYFGILRDAYNDLTGGKGKTFDELVGETGNTGDEQVNAELVAGSGRLEDVRELVLALQGTRKDIATVERILRNKSAAEIRELERLYAGMAPGRSLRKDLFGMAATQAGQDAIPSSMAGMLPPEYAGKASGTLRLNIEDYMQRPDEEGGPAEVLYIVARAEREYAYAIENGGLTGAINDAWGNEPRTLLDETIAEIRRLSTRYRTLIGWAPGSPALLKPENVKSAQAAAIIEQMRLARHVIRGDRAAYEEATAKLRATFEAIASFVLQAVLSAVLTPAAMAMFRVAQGTAQAALMANRIRKFVATVTAGTAANIGTTVAITGDYSLAQLKEALLSNLAGPLGSGGAGKLLASEMLAPVAKGLVARLGPRATAELREFVKNISSMEVSAAATGQSLTENLTIQGMLKEHLMGRAGEFIGEATTKAAGLDGPAPLPEAGAPGEQAPVKPGEAPATPQQGGEPSPDASGAPTPTPPAAEPTGTLPAEGTETASTPAETAPRGPDVETKPVETGPTLGSSVASQPGNTPRGGAVEGTSWQAANRDSEVEAFRLYRRQMAADPTREVAMIYNHDAKEWAVVQGGADSVSLASTLERLGWDPKSTVVGRHSHPVSGHKGALEELTHFPSGRGADLDVVKGDAAKGPPTDGNQWHAIDITVDGKPDRTWVVYSRKTGEWTVDYPDKAERGGRGQKTFATTEEYHAWFKDRFDVEVRHEPASSTETPAPRPNELPEIKSAAEGGGQAPPGGDRPPSAEDLARLARLNDEIKQLLTGKDVDPSLAGEPGPAMERAEIEIDLARRILRNPDATPEMQQMAIEALVRHSVAEYRAKRSAEWEGKGKGPQLTPEALAGCCGVGRDLTADSLMTLLGDSPQPVMIERFQVNNLGVNEQHGFSLVTLPDGSKMLIDPTFAQFGTDAQGVITGGAMLGSVTARDLLRDGMVPFTPTTAREYGIAVGVDPAQADSFAVALMAGEGSILTEIIQNGQVHRTIENPGMAYHHSYTVHGEDTSQAEIRDLLATLPPNDPRRPILDALAARLEELATYQPPIPEAPEPPEWMDLSNVQESQPGEAAPESDKP